MDSDGCDINAVDIDISGCSLQKAEQRKAKSRFPCTCSPNDSNAFTRLNVHVYTFQYDLPDGLLITRS